MNLVRRKPRFPHPFRLCDISHGLVMRNKDIIWRGLIQVWCEVVWRTSGGGGVAENVKVHVHMIRRHSSCMRLSQTTCKQTCHFKRLKACVHRNNYLFTRTWCKSMQVYKWLIGKHSILSCHEDYMYRTVAIKRQGSSIWLGSYPRRLYKTGDYSRLRF